MDKELEDIIKVDDDLMWELRRFTFECILREIYPSAPGLVTYVNQSAWNVP